jgi:uncharacterized membrane protein
MGTHFAKFDSDRIVAAIAAAEKKTSGEIRVHITRRVPKDLEHRAKLRFEKLGMTKTKERNGVLIYIAPRARAFRVLGDTAIHEKCGDAFWQEVAGAMTESFRKEQWTEGVVRGVERVGEVLASHFPRGKGDVNQLPDDVTRD